MLFCFQINVLTSMVLAALPQTLRQTVPLEPAGWLPSQNLCGPHPTAKSEPCYATELARIVMAENEAPFAYNYRTTSKLTYPVKLNWTVLNHITMRYDNA